VNPYIGLPASSIFNDVFFKSKVSKGLPNLSLLLFLFNKYSLLFSFGIFGGTKEFI
jgi:hypothetical protein